MKLDDFCERFSERDFPLADEKTPPELEAVRRARSALSEALALDEFIVSCISEELRLYEGEGLLDVGALVPFFTISRLGVGLAFGYWPPGDGIDPHEHRSWTITAVCRNRLDVRTFDRDESYRRGRLVPKNCFAASSGTAGFIYEPSIHAPHNPTRDWSLSIHVTSPLYAALPRDPAILPELENTSGLVPEVSHHPYVATLAARQKQWCVHLLSRILVPASRQVPDAIALLGKCMALGSSATRRMIETSLPNFATGTSQVDRLLKKSHKDLSFDIRTIGDDVTLFVETAKGEAKALTVNYLARESLLYAASCETFNLAALPGNLSDEERIGFGDALEQTGMFRRVNPQ